MSITSEKQKRYDPTNGGFSYYTLFHADKGERPSFADNGDIVEEFGEGGKAYVCSRDAKGRIKWTEDATWDRQTGGGSGGSGGSYELPTASADTKGGVKIGSGLTMTGEVLSATGGGAEKFVVTLTQDAQTEEWTADKTVAEIVAADAAGKIVVAKYPLDIVSIELPLAVATEIQGNPVAMFGGIDTTDPAVSSIISVLCVNQGSGDAITITQQQIPTSSNEPLIVTLTNDGQSANFVGDKTNAEVYDAFTGGRVVILSATVGTAAFKLAVQYATYDGTDYEFAFIDSSSIKNTVTGGANDYVTASLA